MTLVKFIRDFRGRATEEQFFENRTVVDLPEWQAKMLITEKAAKRVNAKPAPVAPFVVPEPAITADPVADPKAEAPVDDLLTLDPLAVPESIQPKKLGRPTKAKRGA